MRKIILASTSPQRKALLEQLGLEFQIDTSVWEDTDITEDDPEKLVKEISRKKAESVAAKYPDAVIIAADTIGVIGARIIGKPDSKAGAHDILSLLSGKAHTVITGFTVLDTMSGKTVTQSVETEVTFKQIPDEEIEAYVNTGEPMGKAGAYGIQGRAAALVTKIEGDYFNVVGLPLYALSEVLKEFGVRVV